MNKNPQNSFKYFTWLRSTLIALAVLLSVLGITPASAQQVESGATWYVSTTGNDSNDCATTSTPCATINGAIGKAASIDVIKVAIGTYTFSGSGDIPSVVYSTKPINLSGGWDESFTNQNGLSTIDGENAHPGILILSNITTPVSVISRFKVQNGVSKGAGGGIDNSGGARTVINDSIITNNTSNHSGGGVSNSLGELTINNSTISNNKAGDIDWLYGGYAGAGINNYSGKLFINNSTVNDNQTLGKKSANAISSIGTLVINNSTITGNTGGGDYASALDLSGSVKISNTTITKNEGAGFVNQNAHFLLQNSIIAGNIGVECRGIFKSGGYNLLGRNNPSFCRFTPGPGDIIGTFDMPIDPRLAPLADNGGATMTHALLTGSPALGSGNPEVPGTSAAACLATDQRGIARPFGIRCDMGSYEASALRVQSILPADPNPTQAASVNFTVTFSDNVTGVNTSAPFADFSLKSTLVGAAITNVSGSGSTYTVTVKTGTGNNTGLIRLDVVDDGSITGSGGESIGGPGPGNGSFIFGTPYTFVALIPVAQSPYLENWNGWDNVPAYTWSEISRATEYNYELRVGSNKDLVYRQNVLSNVCSNGVCIRKTFQRLLGGTYYWRIRAKVDGVWKPFSSDQEFVVITPKTGFWSMSPALNFYVSENVGQIKEFTIHVGIPACGISNLAIIKPSTSLTKGKFAFGGAFSAKGTFTSETSANGQVSLNSYLVPGCGYISMNPVDWVASWRSSAQPTIELGGGQDIVMLVIPDGQGDFMKLFDITLIKP